MEVSQSANTIAIPQIDNISTTASVPMCRSPLNLKLGNFKILTWRKKPTATVASVY